MKRRHLAAALGLGLVALGSFLVFRNAAVRSKPGMAASSLYSGREPKRKAKLTFPATGKPGFVQEEAEIYATKSRNAQAKQVLLALFKGGQGQGSGNAFPGGWKFREVFVAPDGLAVVDLERASLSLHPGGTTWEYISLYTLLKSLKDSLPEVRALQVLVDGERRESLAGHIDIYQPLTLEDF